MRWLWHSHSLPVGSVIGEVLYLRYYSAIAGDTYQDKYIFMRKFPVENLTFQYCIRRIRNNRVFRLTLQEKRIKSLFISYF